MQREFQNFCKKIQQNEYNGGKYGDFIITIPKKTIYMTTGDPKMPAEIRRAIHIELKIKSKVDMEDDVAKEDDFEFDWAPDSELASSSAILSSTPTLTKNQGEVSNVEARPSKFLRCEDELKIKPLRLVQGIRTQQTDSNGSADMMFLQAPAIEGRPRSAKTRIGNRGSAICSFVGQKF